MLLPFAKAALTDSTGAEVGSATEVVFCFPQIPQIKAESETFSLTEGVFFVSRRSRRLKQNQKLFL
jgi:hypothetical protein